MRQPEYRTGLLEADAPGSRDRWCDRNFVPVRHATQHFVTFGQGARDQILKDHGVRQGLGEVQISLRFHDAKERVGRFLAQAEFDLNVVAV